MPAFLRLPLCELTVKPNSTVKDLRPLLVQALQAQLHPTNLSPPALALAQHPEETRKETCSFLFNTRLKLLVYKGEEVADYVRLNAIPAPLCVLRPADIVAYHCDCAGPTPGLSLTPKKGLDGGKTLVLALLSS